MPIKDEKEIILEPGSAITGLVREDQKEGEIVHRYFPFGPILAKTMVDPKLCKELLRRADKTHLDNRSTLAGHIDKENSFEKLDIQWFIENFKQYFNPYFETFERMVEPDGSHGYKKITGINIMNLWVNYMKAGEFNPPHTHGSDFSFVLYLQVPEGLKQEEQDYKGVGTGPGAIAFYYGEWQKLVRTEHHFMPESGMMFIFPAKLRHTVPPFKCKGTRISVSGNIELLGEVSYKGW